MLDSSVKDFINKTSSSSPTPGGGSVAALVGCLAASLSSMVVSLTKGKKKYLEVEPLMDELKEKLDKIQLEIQEFINKDIEAYNNVVAKYALPKNSDYEKFFRSLNIEKATVEAAIVPLDLSLKLLELYPLIETLLEKGNKNVYSDALISAILCHSAIESALCNVVVNRNLLNGVETKDRLDKKIKEILSKSTETKNRILKSSNYFE